MKEKREVPITYRKSFLAKYIESDDRVKEVYSLLKNRLMAIDGMKSRTSWFYDAFNIGRLNFAKLSVRGKYLALYLNLDVKDYPSNIYHQEFVGDRRRYGDTSFKIHIKSNRTIRYALRLIDDEIKKYNLKDGPVPKINYYLEHEDDLPLIARGLIKIVSKNYVYSPHEQLDVDTYVKKDKNDAIFDESSSVQVIFVDGSKVFVKERRSFEAKLIQSSSTLQKYYGIIKNQLLSYVKVKSRLSWKYESFTIGRIKLAKIQIRGRYLALFLALDKAKYVKKRWIEDASKYDLFSDTPVLIRIKDDDRLELALSLILDLKKRFLLEEGFLKESHDFSQVFESDDSLKHQGLIKIYAKFGDTSSKKNLKIGDEILAKKRNNFIVYREQKRLVLVVDDKNNFVEQNEVTKVPVDGEKEIIYLDVLSKLFNDGDTITLKVLKDRSLIRTDVDYYKVLYRGGTLNKAFTIIASAQSPAVEKIVKEAGGKYLVEVE